MPSLADLEYAFLGQLGATGRSLEDRRGQIYGDSDWAYFSARSGIPASRSLADHELAYYRAGAGVTSGSLTDAQAKAWAGVAPVVTAQPSGSSQSLPVDSVLSLSSSASGFPGATVQWQRSSDGGTAWNPIAGATNPSLSHTLSAANGYATAQTWIYRAVWSNFAGSVNSSPSGVVTIT